jgi:hypothetical protein
MQIDGDSAFCRYLLERHDVAVVPAAVSALRRISVYPTQPRTKICATRWIVSPKPAGS